MFESQPGHPDTNPPTPLFPLERYELVGRTLQSIVFQLEDILLFKEGVVGVYSGWLTIRARESFPVEGFQSSSGNQGAPLSRTFIRRGCAVGFDGALHAGQDELLPR